MEYKRLALLLAWNGLSFGTIIWIVSTVLRRVLGLRIVGLTGSIATGKSTCSKYLSRNGYSIIDFDELAHHVYAVNRPAWKAVRKAFGDSILNTDWTINREKLGQIVWNDKKELSKLNSLLKWPIFKDFLLELLWNFFIEFNSVVILDHPLLIETKIMYYLFVDECILVYCDSQTQLNRLMIRDKLNDEKEAKLKITKQLNIEKKKEWAHVIIDNNIDMDNTLRQLRKWIINDFTIENGMNNFYPIDSNNDENSNDNDSGNNDNSNSNINRMIDANTRFAAHGLIQSQSGNLYGVNGNGNNNKREKRSVAMQKWVNAMKPTKMSLIISTGLSAALYGFYHVLVHF